MPAAAGWRTCRARHADWLRPLRQRAGAGRRDPLLCSTRCPIRATRDSAAERTDRGGTPGTLPADIPLFLSQGGADRVVLPAVTQDYVERRCGSGGRVRFLHLEGATHGFIAGRTAQDAVAWIADRFAGLRAPSDCDRG
jgi:hypothetical protein